MLINRAVHPEGPRRRKVAWALRAMLPLLIVSGAAGCSTTSTTPAHITRPGEGGVNGSGFHSTRPDQSYVLGGEVICLDKPGKVVITGMTPVNPTGGLTVEAWAAIPNPIEGGTTPVTDGVGTIQQLNQPGPLRVDTDGSSPVVDHVCAPASASPRPATPQSTMLFVQVSKSSTGSARDDALAIHYTSAGHQFTFVDPWFFVLCDPDDHTTNGC